MDLNTQRQMDNKINDNIPYAQAVDTPSLLKKIDYSKKNSIWN